MALVKVLIASGSDLEAELRSTNLWRKGGLERIAAITVSDAMKAALEHGPSLVLIALPALAEVEVLVRGLRSDPRTRATAIAILDRGFGREDQAALVQAGANVILPVPVDPFLWDRRLEELLTVPARRDARIPVRLEDWSRFLRESQELEGLVINIGARGVLLESARPFELGAKLGLTFLLPGDPEEVRVVGQVSRQAPGEGGLYRCGVEFLIYRGNARKRVADFVEEAPRRAGTPAALALSVKGLSEGGDWEEELRASELRKAVILDSALDPIVTFDHEGKIVEFNNAARRVFGYSRDEVVGREVAEKMVPPALRDELRRRLREFVETGEDYGGLGRRVEATAMRSDGTELPVEVAVFPAYIKGRVLLTAFLRDLSERKVIEIERARVLSALRESETRITRITEAIPGAVFQFRVGPDGRAVFPFVSRGASELVGIPAGDLQAGFDVWSLVHEDDRPRLVRSIQTSARDLTPWNEVFRVITRGGTKWIRGESLPLRESDRATVWNGIFFDVSEQKAAQEQLEHLNQDLDRRLLELREAEAELQRLARYDSLTGLANRPFFLETLAEVLLRAERRKTRVGLIFMDLDGFKAVNDNLGHEAGDQLLRTVAERIRRSTRRTDSVARIGGDEFTVLVQDLERGDDAALAAQGVLDELVRPCTIGDRVVPVSASAGIAVYPEDGRDGQSLLRHADLAMYKAKQEGKSTYRFFTPAMGQRAQERMLLLSSLKRGLERGEFAVRYQPVIHRNGPPVSLEALVRWEQPEIRRAHPRPVPADRGGKRPHPSPGRLRPARGLPVRPVPGPARSARGREPLRAPVPPARRGGARGERARGERPRSEPARDRGHGARGDDRGRGGFGAPSPAARDRGRAEPRRLRDGLLVPGPPETLPLQPDQDRPQLRARPAGRPRQQSTRLGHDGDGPRSRPRGGGGGGRDARAARLPRGRGLPRLPGILVLPAARARGGGPVPRQLPRLRRRRYGFGDEPETRT